MGNETVKRVDYFDIAKGIGVFLVLIGHLQGNEIFCYSQYILPMCQWIFSFHMPFFFIISGMLIAYKNEPKRDLKDIAKRRFRGIMVPYYWFSFFYMLIVVIAFFKKQIIAENVFLNLWYVLSCYGMGVLWFLPTLFFAELLFIYLIKKFKQNKAIIIIVVQAAIALYLSYLMVLGKEYKVYNTTFREGAHELAQAVVRPFVACSFIAIGYFGFKLIDKLIKIISNKKPEIVNKKVNIVEVLVSVVLLVIGFCLVWINATEAVDFRSLVFRNVAAYYACSVATSFGIILMCKNIPPFRPIKFLGINSLIFMAVHGSEKITYLAKITAMWVNQYLTVARGYICYAIIVLVITAYSVIMIFLINRFAPFIVGKPFRNPFKKAQK